MLLTNGQEKVLSMLLTNGQEKVLSMLLTNGEEKVPFFCCVEDQLVAFECFCS